MKNKIHGVCVLFCIMVGLFACSRANSGTATNNDPNPNGITCAPFGCHSTNCYPFIRFAGNGSKHEMDSILFHLQHNQLISEVLPATQNPTGNWGAPANNMQVSLRFRSRQYLKGKPVPAVVILRNLGPMPRHWWRNALPDHGYQFTVRLGAKVSTWGRPKQKPDLTTYDVNDLSPPRDPYQGFLGPATQDLTVVDLERFFDLNQIGKYSVQVQICIPTSDGKGEVNIISGTAMFEVVK